MLVQADAACGRAGLTRCGQKILAGRRLNPLRVKKSWRGDSSEVVRLI
jgi:hypothetical protein